MKFLKIVLMAAFLASPTMVQAKANCGKKYESCVKKGKNGGKCKTKKQNCKDDNKKPSWGKIDYNKGPSKGAKTTKIERFYECAYVQETPGLNVLYFKRTAQFQSQAKFLSERTCRYNKGRPFGPEVCEDISCKMKTKVIRN